MKQLFAKTFGAMSSAYYLRNLIFGLIPLVFCLWVSSHGSDARLSTLPVFFINTLLYPYARFVYEQVVAFIMGDNIFHINAILFLVAKLVTIWLCWAAAIFLTPLALAHLYYVSRKAEGVRAPQ